MNNSRASGTPKTRIQSQNEALILDAALEVFSTHGYRGSTIDQIADRCHMSKPNLLYYFKRKEDIYRAVLERTLAMWLAPLEALDPTGDPIAELTRYISSKLDLTFERPEASKLFANEILHGAPHIGEFLHGPLKRLVDEKAAIISQWISAGKITKTDPHALIFAIWSVTQHYADFNVQVEAVLGRKPQTQSTKDAVIGILTLGLVAAKG
jgi:TetR/AcrR family transcriptional regulator